jgi:hypothetical protein
MAQVVGPLPNKLKALHSNAVAPPHTHTNIELGVGWVANHSTFLGEQIMKNV